MAKKVIFEIDYVDGVWRNTKSKKGRVTVDKDGLLVGIGFLSDVYFIPWNSVVAISLQGSSNPAFQSVPRYLTGIPGLQTMSAKSVATGVKCFIAVAYTGIFQLNRTKAISNQPNTLRMYAIDMNQADIETHLAQYMHIVGRNAQQLAASQVAHSPQSNTKGRRKPLACDDEDLSGNDDDTSQHSDRDRKASPREISKSLKELAKLYKEGSLTKREFEQAKRKLLQ